MCQFEIWTDIVIWDIKLHEWRFIWNNAKRITVTSIWRWRIEGRRTFDPITKSDTEYIFDTSALYLQVESNEKKIKMKNKEK